MRHIDLAARVFTDDDDGEAGGDAVLGFEASDMARDTTAQILGKEFSVDDFCGHGSLVLRDLEARESASRVSVST
ncbi:hypothetical protein D3C86_1773870 [compost metagenome]